MSSTTSRPASGSGAGASRRSFTLRQIGAAALVALVVVIAQNRERVEVSVLLFDVRAPLWLTLTVMALIGVLIGLLLARRRAQGPTSLSAGLRVTAGT